MNLVDTHAHLDHERFADDREAVIERAQQADIQVVTMGIHLDSCEAAVRLAQDHGLYAAVGIHPHQAGAYEAHGRLDPGVIPALEGFLREERVVAVGEIGLDAVKDFAPMDAQELVFGEMLALAEDVGYPVVIHNRETEEPIARALEASSAYGVVHSFNKDWAFARRILDQGYCLGVNGIATFAKDEALQDALGRIPLDRLLVETDAPFLAPEPHRGKRNEPRFVEHVAQYLAEHRGMALEELAEQTTANAQRLFGLV